MTHSILFMSFGQSNADCHNAGPAFDHPVLDDPRIVLPNDGFGFRGVMGRPRAKMIDGFVPAYGFDPKCQSSGVAAATRFLHDVDDDQIAQVIVRSGAKGGRPLIGRIHRDRVIEGIFREHDGTASILMLSMIEDIYQIAAAADEMGQPIHHIYIPFFHGEADRNTTRATYIDLLTQMMDIIDDACADIGIPTTWLLTQASGTAPMYNGNAWENRLGIKDLAVQRENAVFANANYALPLFDSAHLDATGKVLAGEQIGKCAAQLYRGAAIPAPVTPIAAIADGAMIHVRFARPTATEIDRDSIPAPLHTDGFHVSGQDADFVTSVVSTADGHLTVHCAGPVPADGTLNYAYVRRSRNEPTEDVAFPFGRGCLRASQSVTSLILPDQQLYDWVPAFSLAISAVQQDEKAA